jgi:hypothetical protein
MCWWAPPLTATPQASAVLCLRSELRLGVLPLARATRAADECTPYRTIRRNMELLADVRAVMPACTKGPHANENGNRAAEEANVLGTGSGKATTVLACRCGREQRQQQQQRHQQYSEQQHSEQRHARCFVHSILLRRRSSRSVSRCQQGTAPQPRSRPPSTSGGCSSSCAGTAAAVAAQQQPAAAAAAAAAAKLACLEEAEPDKSQRDDEGNDAATEEAQRPLELLLHVPHCQRDGALGASQRHTRAAHARDRGYEEGEQVEGEGERCRRREHGLKHDLGDCRHTESNSTGLRVPRTFTVRAG